MLAVIFHHFFFTREVHSLLRLIGLRDLAFNLQFVPASLLLHRSVRARVKPAAQESASSISLALHLQHGLSVSRGLMCVDSSEIIPGILQPGATL